jgi:hypothetical protein
MSSSSLSLQCRTRSYLHPPMSLTLRSPHRHRGLGRALGEATIGGSRQLLEWPAQGKLPGLRRSSTSSPGSDPAAVVVEPVPPCFLFARKPDDDGPFLPLAASTVGSSLAVPRPPLAAHWAPVARFGAAHQAPAVGRAPPAVRQPWPPLVAPQPPLEIGSSGSSQQRVRVLSSGRCIGLLQRWVGLLSSGASASASSLPHR